MLEGIDVSGNNGPVDWSRVGRAFAWCKATEGASYADPAYGPNTAGARAAGLTTGGYHFGRPDLTVAHYGGATAAGTAEADWFLSHVAAQPGDLCPALDTEVAKVTVQAMRDWSLAFISRVHDVLGLWLPIYTSPAFWSSAYGGYLAPAQLGCPLWLANWGVTSPTVPAKNWAGHGWTVWQYSSSGSVPGISGRVDLDRAPGPLPIVEDSMGTYTVKAEDWTPTVAGTQSNGVFRAAPDRLAPVIARVPAATVVRSIAEYRTTDPANNNWRLTRLADGTTAFMLRSDWVPVVQGGDPVVDGQYGQFIARTLPGPIETLTVTGRDVRVVGP